ncbi:pilus assembly protein TadG-related protein [Frigidibacter oleivorans]|uniref:pilus assembly protein TadG-related protein n=1 Tax=Frigidibacter oleivorans TaxID=2487129 RepID=UPI0013DFEDA5|nr:pilus assembly protein TadG-related protein [Frigidibacter oleivorans]
MRKLLNEERGAISILMVILFPTMLLVGGLATDITLMNAQKRYVQSQADLAAQSAAFHLPDLVTARDVAAEVVLSNPSYGDVALARTDVLFGRYDYDGGFVASPDQDDPAGVTAVRVSVPSPFDPLLLAPLLAGEDLTIRRSAVGLQRQTVVFTLRNRLLGLDTRESILDAVFGDMLGVTVNVLDYEGLAHARVLADDLLGLATLGLAAEVLTFDDVLDLPVAIPSLLGGLVELGALPAAAVTPAVTGGTVTLDEILALSPGLARLTVGDVLPDVSVNVFDLLSAMAGLASDPTDRVDVDLGVSVPPLADVELSLGIVRPPVTAIAVIGETPPAEAEVTQLDVAVSADITPLIGLDLTLAGAAARAQALTLNCAAEDASDTLATFRVETAPAEIGLSVRLLSLIRGDDMDQTGDPIPVAGVVQQVAVTLGQVGQAIPADNPILLSSVTSSLGTLLADLREDVEAERPNCGPLGLGCLVGSLLGSILGIVNGVVGSVTALLTGLALDPIVQALLDLLGVDVAQAELILDDYACGATLVQ